MNQTELNVYWIQAILYYCFQINSNVFFDTWATQCGSWGYDEQQNLYIENWLLDNETYNIPQPSINTLLSYTAQNVIDFHNSNYLWPSDINSHNMGAYFFASTVELNSIPSARLAAFDGFRAFDTTLKRVVFWNATASEWQIS